MPKTADGLAQRLAARLRFPQLFALTAALFLLDLFLPDAIPFLDEILLGLATVLLGLWKERRRPPPKPPIKDVTPRQSKHLPEGRSRGPGV